MPEAPERIWAFTVGGRRVWTTEEGGGLTGRASDQGYAPPYVLASVADEDRRKLGVALEALKRALNCIEDRSGPFGGTIARCRAAIAEIEGEGKAG